jgi:hypothetical protein
VISRKTKRQQRTPLGWWVGYSTHECQLFIDSSGEPADGDVFRCNECRARWVFHANKERPKSKPSKRKRAALAAMAKTRPKVARRSRGACELRIPGVCLGRAESQHHRQPEGQLGESSSANVIHTCGHGTRGCHGWVEHHRKESYQRGWLVHSWDDPAKVPWSAA